MFNWMLGWFRRRRTGRRATLICMRLADMYLVHPDMVEGVCAQCSEPVGIYPSGQRVKAGWGADHVDIVCHICHPPGRTVVPAPGVLNEIGVSVPRRLRLLR